MADTIRSENGQDEEKKSDQIRKKIEAEVPYMAKPFIEWTLAEKKNFCKVWPFNNFWNNAPGGSYSIRGSFEDLHGEGSFGNPQGETLGTERIAEELKDGKHSERYFAESKEQFCENVKQSLIASGVDIEALQRLVEEQIAMGVKIREMFQRKLDNPAELEEMVNQEADTKSHMNLMLLSAALNLLDNGYTLDDLKE